jgi:hypothetical protein
LAAVWVLSLPARRKQASRHRSSGHTVPGIDEAEFQSLLDQVRDLHRRTDELTRSQTGLHENIRAQLRWERNPPPLPKDQRDVAEEVVEALSQPCLSSNQSRRLFETYFGRR